MRFEIGDSLDESTIKEFMLLNDGVPPDKIYGKVVVEDGVKYQAVHKLSDPERQEYRKNECVVILERPQYSTTIEVYD